MSKKEINLRMNSIMKEAKGLIKEASGHMKGLKKKDRETDDYKQKIVKSSELMKEALKLLDEYNTLSKGLYSNA
jgi:hypothetical protein